MSNNLYIAMPAYNEAANIEKTIKQWHPIVEKISPDSRLVIVNDGSKDNTYEIMESLKDKYPQFVPITKINSGHGSTLLFAYNYCIKANADYIFQTDSDGQTDPDEFWQFWNKRKEYDFIIGYRKHRQDGFSRVIVTKTLKFLVWLIFGENVKDPNTPFRLMNTKKLLSIVDVIPKDFFLSNVIISMLVVKKKEKHLWLPISFKNRQGGVNSINLRKIINIGFKAILDFKAIRQNIKNN